jgi:hypothetical protein
VKAMSSSPSTKKKSSYEDNKIKKLKRRITNLNSSLLNFGLEIRN